MEPGRCTFLHSDDASIHQLTVVSKSRKSSLTSSEVGMLKQLAAHLVRAHREKRHGKQ